MNAKIDKFSEMEKILNVKDATNTELMYLEKLDVAIEIQEKARRYGVSMDIKTRDK